MLKFAFLGVYGYTLYQWTMPAPMNRHRRQEAKVSNSPLSYRIQVPHHRQWCGNQRTNEGWNSLFVVVYFWTFVSIPTPSSSQSTLLRHRQQWNDNATTHCLSFANTLIADQESGLVFAGSVLWTEEIYRTELNQTIVRSIFRLRLPKFGVILVAGCLIQKSFKTVQRLVEIGCNRLNGHMRYIAL